MPGAHPYISGSGNIARMIAQLRKSFPSTVSSETVKRLGIAPNNESYVINALQFVGLLDEQGKKTDKAAKVFSLQNDQEFAQGFGKLVQDAYTDLFELHKTEAWALDDADLVTFFRQADQTSETIGKRQAGVFKVFAGLAGHGEAPTQRSPKRKPSGKKPTSSASAKDVGPDKRSEGQGANRRDNYRELGLSVRIEVNLPPDGTEETYDRIFRSIRKNLLNE